MSIFESYQIAMDVARYTSMIHDGLDTCKHVARNLNPDFGDELDVPESYTGTRVEYIHQLIRSYSNAALFNYAALNDYINIVGLQTAKDAVTAIFGLNADAVQTEIQNMRDVAQYTYNNVLSLTTLLELESGATYIETRIPKWKSIRRRWDL